MCGGGGVLSTTLRSVSVGHFRMTQLTVSTAAGEAQITTIVDIANTRWIPEGVSSLEMCFTVQY